MRTSVVVVPMDSERIEAVRRSLVIWFRREGRDLPWRRSRDPYAVLVSEMMLQQTQVDRVLPKWTAWMERFPTLEALAAASRAEVIRAWSGLGYNLRAVRLHEIAQQAVDQLGGALPRSVEGLLALKGIGRYTAGAVASFAYEQPVAMVDTNVRRVLGRVFLGHPQVDPAEDRATQVLAEQVVPEDGAEAWSWNQALMDLGATVCTVARPMCLLCPLLPHCAAAPQIGTWTDERRRVLRESRGNYEATQARQRSDRQRFYRGRIVEVLRTAPPHEWIPLPEVVHLVDPDAAYEDQEHITSLARRLAADGLLVLEGASSGERARLP